MRSRKNALAAFSLTEVLIAMVIGIVLLALLIPQAKALQRKSYTGVCLSQLRQIGGTMFAYAGDNNGKLPPGYDPDYGYSKNWQEIIEPYNGVSKWNPNHPPRNIYLCRELPTYNAGAVTHGGYVMPRSQWNNPYWPPLASLERPAESVLLFEGDPMSPSLFISTDRAIQYQVEYRHRGGKEGSTILLMADGHVVSESRENLKLEWFIPH